MLNGLKKSMIMGVKSGVEVHLILVFWKLKMKCVCFRSIVMSIIYTKYRVALLLVKCGCFFAFCWGAFRRTILDFLSTCQMSF